MNDLLTVQNIVSVLALVITIAMVISIVITSLRNGITPMPGSLAAQKLMVEEAAKIIEDGTIVEAGSGWGFLALKLSRALPQCKIIGLENSLVPFLFSKFLHFIFKEPNLIFLKKDIYSYDFTFVDMIVCYLYPEAMIKLNTIFNDQSNSIEYVISNTFALPLIKALKVLNAKDFYRSPVYVYYREKSKMKFYK